MTVDESTDSSDLKYTTNWELVNNRVGSIIKSGSATDSAFNLADPADESAYAQLQLDYTNKIVTAPLEISRMLLMKTVQPTTTQVSSLHLQLLSTLTATVQPMTTRPILLSISSKRRAQVIIQAQLTVHPWTVRSQSKKAKALSFSIFL